MANNTRLNQNYTVGDDIATLDVGGVKHEQVINEFLVAGVPVMVSAVNPLPVTDNAAEVSLASIDLKLTNPLPVSSAAQPGVDIGDVTVNNAAGAGAVNIQDGGNSITVDGTVAVTGAGDATAANQITQITAEQAILAKIIAAPATEAKQDTGNTSLASILAKIIAAPATEAKQDTQITAEQAIQASVAAPTTIFNGKTTVTTAGTRVVLASSQTVKSVTIKALSTNTGFIYVGNATVASTNGYQLLAGDSISMDIANLTTVNIDSSVNGEGVSYIGIN